MVLNTGDKQERRLALGRQTVLTIQPDDVLVFLRVQAAGSQLPIWTAATSGVCSTVSPTWMPATCSSGWFLPFFVLSNWEIFLVTHSFPR